MFYFLKVFVGFFLLFNTVPGCSNTTTEPSGSNIVATSDLDTVSKLVKDADKDTLILWDVDQTLITPNDSVLRPKWEQYLDQLLGGKKVMTNELGEKRYIFREILMKAPHSLINSQSVSLIEELQNMEIPVIAFTAAPGGKIGEIDSFLDWRIRELEEFGFQFGATFSNVDSIQLPKDPDKEFPPIYKSGVIITSLHEKGPVLTNFFKEINWVPKKVIFIDDKMSNLESVEQSLKDITQVLGIHYTAANDLPADLDEEMAKEQVDHFLRTNEWVSQSKLKNLIK